jgi:oligopeptide transport system substrate-binding protein
MARFTSILTAAAVALAIGAGAGAAQAQKVLQRGNGAEPETLDVHKSSGVPEANIQADLFEGLVHFGPEGRPIAGVAEKWSLSADGTVYTFNLRANAKWSNGDPVTAEDFVYSFRRALDPKTASKYAFILFPIKNGEEVSRGQVPVEQIGARAVDARTLEVTLKSPTPYFLDMLAHHMGYPVHAKTVAAHGDRWTRPGNIVSNGAYMLVEWTPQSHIRARKNPHYWDAANAKIDEVVFHATEDRAAELKRFRAGELDIGYEAPIDQIGWMKANLKDEFRPTPYLGTYYFGLNLTKAPFKDNVKLRQALAMAIDRETLVDKITVAGEVPAYSWVAPGVGNDYKAQRFTWADLPQARKDEEARKLVVEAGFGPGKPLKIEILYNTNENHRRIAIAIAGMWKEKLGIDVELRNEEWKVYLASRDAKNFTAIRQGWIGDYNDANTFMELMKSDIGKQNSPGYASADYDRLVKQAERTTDLPARARMMEEAERIFLNDVPIIPIYHYVSKRYVKANVVGWVNNVMDMHPTRHLDLRR